MHALTYLGDTVLHNLLARQVGLVAHKQLVHSLGSVSVDLLQPLLDVPINTYRRVS